VPLFHKFCYTQLGKKGLDLGDLNGGYGPDLNDALMGWIEKGASCFLDDAHGEHHSQWNKATKGKERKQDRETECLAISEQINHE